MLIVKEFKFEAAHFLPDYEGPCANIHGHTYRLLIGVEGKIDSDSGMIMDFSKLKEIVVDRAIRWLDHSFLNEMKQFGFPWNMPTAENMVLWIRYRLENIAMVRLYETPTSYVEWRK